MMSATTTSHKTAVQSFLRMAAAGEARRAFSMYVGDGFRHHNPHVAGTSEALITAMEENARQNPEKTIEFKRLLEEDDQVCVVSHVRMKKDERGYALVHIFRFEHDRIVELWDIAQPIPDHSPNTNGMW
jgi:predicted SnoaL-like aldol condensation-catalyzing enzyme